MDFSYTHVESWRSYCEFLLKKNSSPDDVFWKPEMFFFRIKIDNKKKQDLKKNEIASIKINCC